jgi:hypothetical protein
VGKTYFWHQFKEQLTDKKVAYISLFGKETISSIRTDVFLQVIIYGIVISLMCFAVACQAFCFLGITCKNTSVRILEIVSLPNKEI